METDEPKYVIYGLHAGDGVIRYVGKTVKGASRRLAEHRWKTRKKDQRRATAVNRWMRKHGVENIDYTILEATDDPEKLNALEVEWIALFRAAGNDLMNLTDGGEGALGHYHTAEYKKHMSELMSGRYVSPETCARISATKKGVPNVNYPKHIGPMSELAKAHISAATLGHPKPPGHGAKVSLAIRGQNHGMAKLKREQVIAIIARIEAGEPDAEIAADYIVSDKAIGKIRRGERWTHIPRSVAA